MKADDEMKAYIEKRFVQCLKLERKYIPASEPIKHGFYMGSANALLDLLEILETGVVSHDTDD